MLNYIDCLVLCACSRVFLVLFWCWPRVGLDIVFLDLLVSLNGVLCKNCVVFGYFHIKELFTKNRTSKFF